MRREAETLIGIVLRKVEEMENKGRMRKVKIGGNAVV